jgi:hypothetical protein
VLGFSGLVAIYLKWQQAEFRIPFLTIWAICAMVLGETILVNSAYLINYAISLAIGFYFILSKIPRILTFCSILLTLALSFTNYQMWGLFAVLVFFVIKSGKRFSKIGTLVMLSLGLLIICTALHGHHHWLSLPFRKIMEYTTLTITPLCVMLICPSDSSQRYQKVPDASMGSAASGMSLPGFEEMEEADN